MNSIERDRYAEAIDSVLADEFLTRAVTQVVVAVADAEMAELRADVEALRRDYAELMSVVRARKPDLPHMG